MAAQPNKKLKLRLNLLHPQGVQEKLPVKFLKWLLNYGRFIVVIVEIIVLGTFLARFSLDSTLSDLKDNINRQALFIDSFKTSENLIRQTQFKLQTFQLLRNTSTNFPEILNIFSANTPQGVSFKSIGIDNPNKAKLSFKISGSSTSNNDLALFLNSLKQNSKLINVNLTSISLEEGLINFAITGDIK